ncbi:Transposon Tf2-6 polyprotein [Caligus rogercresseyi]|uniref:Transposon Tf2-6 polyprotein n=1 Tax=Caligus rogercresseyi TaxID=217165 RepID=A0A7T8K8D9_CALRO|nr:Transposon Tf2-6 polyprotein [Caligus rogercresseyi]
MSSPKSLTKASKEELVLQIREKRTKAGLEEEIERLRDSSKEDLVRELVLIQHGVSSEGRAPNSREESGSSGDAMSMLMTFMRQQQEWQQRQQQQQELLTQTLMGVLQGSQGRETIPVNDPPRDEVVRQSRRTQVKKMDVPHLKSPEGMDLADFRDWRELFEDYSAVTRLAEDDEATQRGILRSALHEDWTKMWSEGTIKVPAEAGMATILDILYINGPKGISKVSQSTYKKEMRGRYVGKQHEKSDDFQRNTPSDQCKACVRAHDKGKCKAKALECYSCGRKGHVAASSMCKSKKDVRTSNSIRLGNICINSVVEEEDLVRLETRHRGRFANALPWLPDTGARADAMSLDHVNLMKGEGTFKRQQIQNEEDDRR